MKRAKQAGYDGVEIAFPAVISIPELDLVWNLAAKHNLEIITQHCRAYDVEFNLHYDNYCKWIETLAPYKSAMVNSHTGRDYFTFEQNKKLIDFMAGYSKKHGVPVSHETHRSRFNFAAHVAKEYLKKIPGLRFTLDISHWVNVAESYLDDQQEAVELAISRTDYIHARVGHTQGPQVPDPRVPEWQDALNRHLVWWDKVIVRKKAEGGAEFNIAPEFGAFPYMLHLPSTGQPVIDQWEVNVFMMDLLRERYK